MSSCGTDEEKLKDESPLLIGPQTYSKPMTPIKKKEAREYHYKPTEQDFNHIFFGLLVMADWADEDKIDISDSLKFIKTVYG